MSNTTLLCLDVNWQQFLDFFFHSESPLQKCGKGKGSRGSFAGCASWFDPDMGACGKKNGPGDFIVALDAAQFNLGWCGKKIEISFGGKSTAATIVDECPGCPLVRPDNSAWLSLLKY